MSSSALRTSHYTFEFSTETLLWLWRNAVVLAIYWSALSYCYVNGVVPINATASFLYLRASPAKEVEGLVWALLLLPTVTFSWKKPSDFGFTILYFIAFVPTLILFGLADQPRASMYPIIAGYLAVFIACRSPIHIPFVRLRQGASSVYLVAGGIILVATWYAVKGNHSAFNADLLKVYEYRDEANDVFDVGPLKYIAQWVPTVLNPFFFCYMLYRRRWMLFFLSICFQFYCIVIFQQKFTLVPALLLPLFLLCKDGHKGQFRLILLLAISVIVCQLIYIFTENYLLIQFWTRRFFFDQQFLYFSYHDVFSRIGYVYYSDSFLGGLIHYPFTYSPSPMVSYYVAGKPDGSPNTGFFGAGYMELGDLGIVLNGAMIGLVLRLFDRVVPSGTPMWFTAIVAFSPFMAMIVSQNFVTSILTGGIAILFVLMLCSRHLEWAFAAKPGVEDQGQIEFIQSVN